MLACNQAYALDDDVLKIEVLASQRYDSNLFSLPNDVDPPINGRRSATTRSTGVNLRIDKSYGQQRFDLYGSVTHEHYDPYDNLDFTAHTYGASWAWTLTPELTGNISVDESKVPNSFSDTGFQTNPNPRTQQSKRFDASYASGAALHPRLAIFQIEDKSAQTTIERQNAQTDSIEAAMVYEFRSTNTAEIYVRRGRGHYFDVTLDPNSSVDSEFNDREVGVAAHWTSSGLSHFDGRVGYMSRDHKEFAQRNFDGIVAQLDYTYVATGKTQIQVSASRTLSASETAISSYSQDQIVSVRPIWAATGKITVKPSYSILQRDFRGSVTPNSEHLRMTQRDAALQVDWDVLRSLSISASVLHSVRTSNDPSFQYTNRGGLISGTLKF